ncbi:aromatic ring-hydroxylating dioxygenase subunit alpha [Bacillus sp. 3255]|uniref:aromatic ring-hydroxylating dioxygenase subunit alpha n=1 Tax=Bacillus sp. 3255 TaxID=2817904 RepID=UPI00286326AD|nr:aromatic ring-hydroxylating dioxygenase subunit alpha [Bacillus sp. 3255]MDR6880470.1 phenylpropionate dioxygenase-like ring-hydroxylating dioxygenase large terminal subunit [Bacillus sp. 3255]
MSDTILYREIKESDQRVFPLAWYAVGWSKELSSKPIKRRLLGKDVVLYRDSAGALQAIHAYCPHRGADLSLGSCRGGQLRCAYHAWTFDADGRCIDIPAHPERAIPEFAHTVVYPAIERAGLLWVYPQAKGDKSQELLLEPQLFAELNDPTFKWAAYDAKWNAHLTRVIESVIDVAHVPIVHRKTIGKNSSVEIRISFETEGDDILVSNGGAQLKYRFPQQWILTPIQEAKNKFINYVTFTPIEEEITAIYGYAGRNFATFVPGMNYLFSKYSSRVLEEDRDIVESQHPRPIPEALRMEAHVPADGPQVRFRQRWYKFLAGNEPRIYV